MEGSTSLVGDELVGGAVQMESKQCSREGPPSCLSAQHLKVKYPILYVVTDCMHGLLQVCRTGTLAPLLRRPRVICQSLAFFFVTTITVYNSMVVFS